MHQWFLVYAILHDSDVMDADMIGLVCNTIRKLFCMSDEGYEIFLMDLENYKVELEEEDEEWVQVSVQYIR